MEKITDLINYKGLLRITNSSTTPHQGTDENLRTRVRDPVMLHRWEEPIVSSGFEQGGGKCVCV